MASRDKGISLNVRRKLTSGESDTLWKSNSVSPCLNQESQNESGRFTDRTATEDLSHSSANNHPNQNRRINVNKFLEQQQAGFVLDNDLDSVGTVSRQILANKEFQFQPQPAPKIPKTKLSTVGAVIDGSKDEDAVSESFQCLWTYLRLARFFGMCPISKVGPTTLSALPRSTVQRLNMACTHIIHGLLFLNASYLLVKSFTVYGTQNLVDSLQNFLYYTHCFLNGLFMSWRVAHLPKLLLRFKKVELICDKYRKSNLLHTTNSETEKYSLVKMCNSLVLVTLACQILTNSLYFSSVVYRYNSTTIVTYLTTFNDEIGFEWGNFYSGMIFWMTTIYCDLGWAFTEVLLSILCIIISRYYSRLNMALAGAESLHYSILEEMRADHREITRLVQTCNSTLSPLFLISYLGNAGYLFARLFSGITEDLNDPHWLVNLETVTAFLFQMARILLPTWLAANLNEKAHDALVWVHSWPSSIDLPNSNFRVLVIGRFVSQLTAYQVGISGCGYFIINKSFLVALISAFFTYEVIILQFQKSGMKAT